MTPSAPNLINGYLALCLIPVAEKIAAQLKRYLTLIMLSNELNFCSIN